VLRIAQEEIERMSRLLADLLLLAQADAGVKLEKRPVELDTLLLEVFRQEKPLAGEVQLRLGTEDQATVLGDPDRLKQLLLNLVDNALKYTLPEGQVTLGMSREGGWATVTVIDTGPGIPAEDLPRLFDRFYRVEKSRSRPQGGTGLGLSIARWIAEAHGGGIEVQSEVGKGSTFTVRLPLAPGQ
jgi:two-component system OmpR family sensor kinase